MKRAVRTALSLGLLFLFVCTGCRSESDVIPEKEEAIPQESEETVIPDEREPEDDTEEERSYITPEEFGAKADGIKDDTSAFEKCMKSLEKYVYLSGMYRITANIQAESEKHFIAESMDGKPGASVICEPEGDYKTLTFLDKVTFENIDFYSGFKTTGESPHKEIYSSTSNVVFVEVWNTGTFKNCAFTNALIAIRGRKTESSPVIPSSITADGCTFTECKIPVQGFSENTVINRCKFLNDGDLYGGDHCIYIERYGCQSLTVRDCFVETKNSESGHAFQIYGEPKAGDVIPELRIENCKIHANGITSSSAADVVVDGCEFFEQRSGQFILIAESGSVNVRNSEFHHAYAFSYAGSTVEPYAENCVFERLPCMGSERCNFPQESVNCTYINWGGNVRVADTKFTDCTFSYTGNETLNGLYIRNSQNCSLYLKNTRFQSGSSITDNEKALKEYTGCVTFN